jgi:competence protein ComEA
MLRAAMLATVLATGTLVAAPPALADEVVVNINTADAATLADVLDGVGLARAQAIVAWREANGRFGTVDDLAQVKGIGPSVIEKNRARIRIE